MPEAAPDNGEPRTPLSEAQGQAMSDLIRAQRAKPKADLYARFWPAAGDNAPEAPEAADDGAHDDGAA